MPLKLCFAVFAAVAIVIFPISSQAQLVLRAGTILRAFQQASLIQILTPIGA